MNMNSKQLNILLADDDADDCLFFKEALVELPMSMNLIAVHDGEQLMHLLINETIDLPDILFLDLNMPRKNGFECLSEIKSSEKLKRLPVIVFSTSFEQEVVNRLYSNGAHYFIRKPSEFSQYKKIIQQSLELVDQGVLTKPAREDFVLTVKKIL
jgi:CheY-like chemotaxis protein